MNKLRIVTVVLAVVTLLLALASYGAGRSSRHSPPASGVRFILTTTRL